MSNKFIPVNTPLITESDANEVYKTIKSGWISSSGEKILQFEKKVAKIVKRKFACAVSSGTAALEIAVKSLNINKDDEIIMPSFTIISNALAIIKSGAKPILIDSDIESWNIKIDQIVSKITKKTRAIMLPHIYGFPCDMDKITKICKEYNLYLIEDAAEMMGQYYKKRPCGSFGEISTFSFYANKHITTGEGGMLLTNKKNLYEKFKKFRNLSFGKKNRFNHDDISWNYRLTNMQATLGLNQLKRLKKIVEIKRTIGCEYYKRLKDNNKIIIQKPQNKFSHNIFWVFGILLKNKSIKYRIDIQKKLLEKGIETRPFFWPMHKQNVFKKLKLFKVQHLKNCEYLANSGFYLPSGINLKMSQIKYITKTVNQLIK